MPGNQNLSEYKVVLRFQYGNRGSRNPVVSRTLGKLAVVSHAYEGPSPQPGKFWLCSIEREIGTIGKGCYAVVPIREVPFDQIMRLVPGTYDTEIWDEQQTIVCEPKLPGMWLMPFNLKRYLLKPGKAKILYQSVLVPVRE